MVSPLLQDFILEHYSEDGNKYENAIAEFTDIRQVSLFYAFFSSETPMVEKAKTSLLYLFSPTTLSLFLKRHKMEP